MDIKDCLTYAPALPINANTKQVKEGFHEQQATHLPVVDKENFVGCISLEDSYTLEAEANLADHQYLLNRMYVSEKANWMELLQEFSSYNADLLPVLATNGTYIGYIKLKDFIYSLGKLAFLNESGTVLVLEAASHHFSASQVSQIIESNNAKVISMFLTSFEDNRTKCSLKINTNNINEIVQSFRRYNYQVVSEHIEDSYIEGLKERSKYLQKYLNI